MSLANVAFRHRSAARLDHPGDRSIIETIVYKLLLAFVCVACSLLAVAVAADEEESKPTHRVDFGLSWFDTPDQTTVNGGLYYAWAPSHHHSFTGALAFVNAQRSNATDSGVGDLKL